MKKLYGFAYKENGNLEHFLCTKKSAEEKYEAVRERGRFTITENQKTRTIRPTFVAVLMEIISITREV